MLRHQVSNARGLYKILYALGIRSVKFAMIYPSWMMQLSNNLMKKAAKREIKEYEQKIKDFQMAEKNLSGSEN